MQKFTTVDALVAPFDQSNIDTDAIIPKQFMKSIQRSGFGVNLFDEWRYLDHGEPGQDCSVRPLNQDFVLNQTRYRGAGILLARANFGCGSSREHAPWALYDYGFRVLIASSFADIFFNNCFKSGLLPIVLPPSVIDTLFNAVESTPGFQLKVDLASQTIVFPDLSLQSFDVDPFRKHCLLNGLDEIGLTLDEDAEQIRAYEAGRRELEPWLFR